MYPAGDGRLPHQYNLGHQSRLMAIRTDHSAARQVQGRIAVRAMRGRADQLFFAVSMFAIGVAVYLLARLSPGIMTPEEFGQVAYDIDAETWALGFMGSAAAVIYGVTINGRWRWSATFRLAGFASFGVMFGTLALSALSAQHGSAVVVFGALYFVPRVLVFIRSNVADVIARW